MSTKTTFKRIALVAVAALGFGVLTSVAPATAASITPTAVTVGTVPTAAVGVAHTTPVSFAAPYGNANDTFTITVRVTSAPTGSVYAGILGNGKKADGASCRVSGATTDWLAGLCYSGSGNTTVPATMAIASSATARGVVSALTSTTTFAEIQGLMTNTGWTDQTATTAGVSITPDVAGTYTVLVSTSNRAAAAGTTYTAGDANATYTFSTGTKVATATLATVTGATVTGATNTVGRLMKLTLNAGSALGAGETIALTTNNTSAALAPVTQSSGATGTYAASLTLDNSNFVNGVAFFKLTDTTATANTTVVTASGSGLLTSAGVLSTVSSTTVLLAAASAITVNNGVDAVRPGSGHTGGGVTTSTTAMSDAASTTATTHTYGISATTASATASVNRMFVTDTSGEITGIANVTYETTVSAAAGTSTTALGTVSFTATLENAESFVASIRAANGTTELASITVTGDTAEVTTATAEPGATIYATHGTSVVATVLIKDQFGAAVANSALTVSVTGRNATTSSAALATDATGRASFTLADAGTAATVLTQSVIVFNTALATDTTVTINYGVDKVSTVTLTTPTTLDTAATGITYSDINASSTAGASASTQTITATVTDVNGAVLVGVPVTFSTASEGAGILTTTVTVYTGTDGKAAASVFGWTAGVKTFTATAGAKSVTGTVAYRQGGATGTNSATEARTIEAVKSGNSIIVTAKDRFGNVVSGVPLWGTRTGNGTFGGGSNTNGQTTGADGTAEFLFNAGSEDSVVTITAGSATATPLPCYAQTGHLAGMNVCSTATTQTAYTASTVGTTTTAQTGVGATFAPAGISSVTVAVPAGTDSAQVAADAAAEATDAANAATDAANAAAEAADAATAAAQDAADAVAALSTQVTELVSALRKQITSLTNLVIKIQRKVRA
jgi:trimeric autotransporter adhesin